MRYVLRVWLERNQFSGEEGQPFKMSVSVTCIEYIITP
jgi:hypothetical protein